MLFCKTIFSYKHLQWSSYNLNKKTLETLLTIYFKSDDILKISKNFDPNKAQGHDMISIWMVKLCDASLCKPLELIFKSGLESGKFPLKWKNANVVSVHKKETSKYWKITVPYLCFPLLEKYLKILYNNMFEFFV